MRKHAGTARVRRIQNVSTSLPGRKPTAEPWSKTASQRVAKRLPLGASLLEEMDESGFPAPVRIDRASFLPEPPIERTSTGGEPLNEWKPLLLEHERPPEAVNLLEAEAFRKRELEIVKYVQRRIAELSSKPDLNVAAEQFMKVYNAWKKAKKRPYRKRLALEACNIAIDLIRLARQRKDSEYKRKKKISELTALLKAFASPPDRGMSQSHSVAPPLDSREELFLIRHMLRDRKAPMRAEAEAAIEPLVSEATEPLYASLRKLWAAVEPYGISAPVHRAKTSNESSKAKEEDKK